MAEAITSLIAAIPSGALPIVVVILGLAYLYFKFSKVEKDREVTKQQRDSDSQAIHDTLLKHSFQIDELKGRSVHHEEILDDLRKQVTILNENIVKLSVMIENLIKK